MQSVLNSNNPVIGHCLSGSILLVLSVMFQTVEAKELRREKKKVHSQILYIIVDVEFIPKRKYIPNEYKLLALIIAQISSKRKHFF